MHGRAPLLAFWQLGSSWMLLWGLAAALPILIHLWTRRRHRQVPWAAMQFLVAAMQKHSRRILLEQWLLLAVRTLILLLLSLALADPALTTFSPWTGVSPAGQSHTLFVIDGSYSMDYRRDEQPRFAATKDLIGQHVAAAGAGERFSLILMSEPPRVVIGEPAAGQDFLDELETLVMPHAGANLTGALAEVETLLKAAERREPDATRKAVFYTDLGKTTWGEANTKDCRDRLARIAALAQLTLVDLGQPGEQNWAVARLEAQSSLATTAADVTFQAEIQSFQGEARVRQRVELIVDGQPVAEQRLDIPAGGRATAVFSQRFDSSGEHVVEVRIPEDRLPLDNRRFLSLPVREAIRVLAVDGKPGEARDIALALDPVQGDRSRIVVDRATETALTESDLAKYDCLVLCNVGRFSRAEAARLHAYVAGGGGLITFLGDQVQAESYNAELAQPGNANRVLPAKIGAIQKESMFRLNPLNYAHPIVAPFRGHPRSGLLTTPIWRYFQLAPHAGAKVALAFDAGDAAIVEERIGRGRSILVSTAASAKSIDHTTTPPTPWTALSSWPSFPPLIHEMLELSIRSSAESKNVIVGEELSAIVPGAAADTSVVIAGPELSGERAAIFELAGQPQWRHGGVMLSGIYEARIGPPVSATQRFAVNPPSQESDLERLPSELLPMQFSSLSEASPAQPGGSTGGEAYFRMILAAVIALVLLETHLAWQMGRSIA